MRNTSDKIVDKVTTHILFPATLFDNRAVYELM